MGLQLSDQQLDAHVSLYAAYIQSWANEIQNAPEELFRAIKDAERISDYLLEAAAFPTTREVISMKASRSRLQCLRRVP